MVEPAFFVPVRPLLFSLGAARVHVNAFAAPPQAAGGLVPGAYRSTLLIRASVVPSWLGTAGVQVSAPR